MAAERLPWIEIADELPRYAQRHAQRDAGNLWAATIHGRFQERWKSVLMVAS